MEYITLSNGLKMPKLGYGTYLSNTVENVQTALKTGYRLIDTAQWYENESEVGKAIRLSGIPRSEIFITSKTCTEDYKNTLKGIDESLKRLQTNYIDLMIIHWPMGDPIEIYKALETAYKQGKLKAIGLSNFNSAQCTEIMRNCEIKPMINQIETHIYMQEKKIHKFLTSNNIVHESYSPFAVGKLNTFKDKQVKIIADKYKKTTAQVMLRFLVQENIVVIPKSSKDERIKENFNIFDFKLTDEEINIMRKLDRRQSSNGWPSSMKCEQNYDY